jgi:hypothetical protein
MTASTGNVPDRIFMSYRREEAGFPAGWLYDRLVSHFDSNQVFRDIDSIELGDDFVERITTAVGSCHVLLALIGDRWLTITDQDGRRRLDNPGDFVRVEIEAALSRNVRVIPILVDGARMPSADELPASLAKLSRRQALELSANRFDSDVGRLLKVLDWSFDRVQELAERVAAQRRKVEQLQGQVRERAAAQDWDAVVATSDELAALDPAAADPDGLASTARDQITRRKQAEEAATRQDWRVEVYQLQGQTGDQAASTLPAPPTDPAPTKPALENAFQAGEVGEPAVKTGSLKRKMIAVSIQQGILWVGAEAYPLRNIARAATKELTPNRGAAVRRFLTLSSPKLYALTIETVGTQHTALVSTDNNLLYAIAIEIMSAIDNPQAAFQMTVLAWVPRR